MQLRAIYLLTIAACLVYCFYVAAGAIWSRGRRSGPGGGEPVREWPDGVERGDRLEQFKLIYDYIKFHLGMYLATPPVIALIAESFGVTCRYSFQYGLVAMIVIYFTSGAHAGWFMGRFINDPWRPVPEMLREFEADAFSSTRRNMHHTFYWAGLILSLLGLILAIFFEGGQCPPATTQG